MSAPVLIEVSNPITQNAPNSSNIETTGFPFDDSDFEERDRSRSFRSTLDDIAKRHPEFAEHLNFEKFPIRSNTWGHRRRGAEDSPKTSRFDEFADHFDKPSGSRFKEKFGFPFGYSFDEPPEHLAPKQEPAEESKPPQVPKERGRKTNPNIPQSSTVDLGQKQEPVCDIRGQRSMSAPPENRAGQRYVSSINIPINTDAPDATNPSQQPQQPKSHERVIPIHVEGRDEPVMPKQQTNQTYSQPPPPPHTEKMFGQQRPGFGSWKRDDMPYYTGDPKFFQSDPHFEAGIFPQEQPNTDHHFPSTGAFKQQSPKPTPLQKSPTPPPQQHQSPPQPAKLGPIEQIQRIQKDVLELMNQVEQFNGRPKDRQYIYLDEMLTRNLLKLDDVETEGKENIRHARKEAINCIQKCISILEAKAMANEQLRSGMDTTVKKTPSITSLEVSGVSRSGSENIGGMDVEQTEPETVENVPDPIPVESNETEVPNTQETVPEDSKPADDSMDASQAEVNVKSEENKDKKKVKKKEKTEKVE